MWIARVTLHMNKRNRCSLESTETLGDKTETSKERKQWLTEKRSQAFSCRVL